MLLGSSRCSLQTCEQGEAPSGFSVLHRLH